MTVLTVVVVVVALCDVVRAQCGGSSPWDCFGSCCADPRSTSNPSCIWQCNTECGIKRSTYDASIVRELAPFYPDLMSPLHRDAFHNGTFFIRPEHRHIAKRFQAGSCMCRSGACCARDCWVGAWGMWSACSATCGTGSRWRARVVGQAFCGGTDCPPTVETEECYAGCCTQPCPTTSSTTATPPTPTITASKAQAMVPTTSASPVPSSTLTASTLSTMLVPPTVRTTTTFAFDPDDGALVGGIVGGVAVVLLLAVVAALLIWRFKRADKAENNDGALKPANHYIPHAADFKVEEGPRYDSLSTGEAGATLPINDRGRGCEAAASLRKAKANLSDSAPRKPKSTDAESNPSHLSGLSGRSSKIGSEFSSARVEAWAIDASDLELGSVLGQGAFGVVRRAEWHGRTVAVKQIKKSSIGDDKAVADFEEEIGRMAALPMHENVVRLFGVVELTNGDIGAVVEFCAQGALVAALYGEKARDFSPNELLQIAYDAACGVMHLHANKIVHRDIAARNVLLAGKKDLVAKVSDFGMARDVEGVESGAEQQTKASIGPIRWMAPEQLERLAYSKASDVFAFGVLLYEIFARAAPWAGVANVNVITQVLRGNRMELSRVPTELRDTVQRCWAQEPRDRPTMQQVVLALKM